AAARAGQPEKPAWERWLAILRIVLPHLERAGPSPAVAAAVARVRHSVALLEEYGVTDARSDPWQYLEYFCHACVLRMGWTGHAPAFADPEYDDHLAQVVAIERGRRGPPRPWPDPGG